MADTFQARTEELLQKVGSGHLRGSVVVDQVYAKYQHERTDLKHPRGGQAKFLSAPLRQYAGYYLQHLANNVLEGDLDAAMADNMEHLENQAETLAPRLLGNLRRSGSPEVQDGLVSTYDRPPEQRRLTEAELDAQGRRTFT